MSGEGRQGLQDKGARQRDRGRDAYGSEIRGEYPIGALRLGLGDATMSEGFCWWYCGDRSKKADLENAYNLCSDLGLVGEVLASKGITAIDRFKVSLFNPIRPALAERLHTAEEILEQDARNVAVESKYADFRCHVDRDGKRVKIYSRRLEDITAYVPGHRKGGAGGDKGRQGHILRERRSHTTRRRGVPAIPGDDTEEEEARDSGEERWSCRCTSSHSTSCT